MHPMGRECERSGSPINLTLASAGVPSDSWNAAGLLDGSFQTREIDQLFDATIKTGHLERAEELARAQLAQYVIWVKQHTARTMNVAPALHRQLVEIDVPALDGHIQRMLKLLVANEHTRSFLPQLRYISTVIGVPELSIRMVARAAQWLLASGDYASALAELRRLGEIDHLNDTLALVLASKLLTVPDGKRTEMLTRAVDVVLIEEEKWFAQLELASHLSACGQRADALLSVESVVRECRDKNDAQEPLARALFLRAQITGQREDVVAAKEAMQVFAHPERETHIAIMLIDHGDFDEAEELFSDALKAKEPIAQLLTIDARLRSGQIDAAHNLLLSVDREKITPRLLYPYAVTCALVAVARGDGGLKDKAIAALREVPCGGTRLASDVNGMLDALSDDSNSGRESLMARAAVFLRRAVHSVRG
jgi:tetratricopeptide (TPR) repeat protein